jgi:ATP-dependent RNA helicase SUPV3L1/SUV3
LRSFDLNSGRIIAALGPTNTGKTHRALERMLAHPTGMIGLPLRLLAQEVHARLEKERPGQVALITGEQKIIPPNPRYWVCTVEAMPMDVPVHFMAIDEIQLSGQRNRGHTFTERLLHARGVRETWFMGSDTIAPLLQQLVPTAEIEQAKRMSTLRYTGPRKLLSLPKRSAVVAFSAEQVYEIAERLRRKHGGAAVVLGALSPRARNAQVALYESGEVDYLVATDAIGMGLNLDVDHVALAATRKFDGWSMRDLRVDELAQIAGRAGRFTRDGTFGTLNSAGPLDPDAVHAIENHRFPPLRGLYWRNNMLDFGSLSALLGSLDASSPRRCLRQVREWPDHKALEGLAELPQVQVRVHGEAAVKLTWEVAQIPDFRKTLTGAHVQLLAQLLEFLLERGEIPASFLQSRLARLDREDGDIDALMARIAWVRTWNYVANRKGWLVNGPEWQRRCAEIEDRLSQALHKALTRRFVSRRSVVLTEEQTLSSGDQGATDLTPRRHEISGSLRGLRYSPAPGKHARKLGPELERDLREELGRRVHRLIHAPDNALMLDVDGRLSWEGALVASLGKGPGALFPQVQLLRNRHLAPPDSALLVGHLQLWLGERVREALGPLAKSNHKLKDAGRALLDRLQQNLGSMPTEEASAWLPNLTPIDRKILAQRGVKLGRLYIFAPPTDDAARYARALLVALFRQQLPLVELPHAQTAVCPARLSPHLYAALGMAVIGGMAIEMGHLEGLAAALRKRSSRGPFALDRGLIQQADMGRDSLNKVLLSLGYERDGERYTSY